MRSSRRDNVQNSGNGKSSGPPTLRKSHHNQATNCNFSYPFLPSFPPNIHNISISYNTETTTGSFGGAATTNSVAEKRMKLVDYRNGTYQGTVLPNGQRSSLGLYTWDSGEVYFGEWKNDMLEGEGILFFPLGGFIHGFFAKNKLNGASFFKFANGDIYEGFWRNGKLEGNCYKYFTDENRWILSDYKNGEFKRVISKGEDLPPSYVFNYITSAAEMATRHEESNLMAAYQQTKKVLHQPQDQLKAVAFSDGGQYIGLVKDTMPSSLGIYRYADGKYDVGQYKNGSLNGLGRLHLHNGDVYDGTLSDGLFHGKGIFFQKATASWIYGNFEENKCVNILKKGQGTFPDELVAKYRMEAHLRGSIFVDKETPSSVYTLPLYNQQPVGPERHNFYLDLSLSKEQHQQQQQSQQQQSQQFNNDDEVATANEQNPHAVIDQRFSLRKVLPKDLTQHATPPPNRGSSYKSQQSQQVGARVSPPTRHGQVNSKAQQKQVSQTQKQSQQSQQQQNVSKSRLNKTASIHSSRAKQSPKNSQQEGQLEESFNSYYSEKFDRKKSRASSQSQRQLEAGQGENEENEQYQQQQQQQQQQQAYSQKQNSRNQKQQQQYSSQQPRSQGELMNGDRNEPVQDSSYDPLISETVAAERQLKKNTSLETIRNEIASFEQIASQAIPERRTKSRGQGGQQVNNNNNNNNSQLVGPSMNSSNSRTAVAAANGINKHSVSPNFQQSPILTPMQMQMNNATTSTTSFSRVESNRHLNIPSMINSANNTHNNNHTRTGGNNEEAAAGEEEQQEDVAQDLQLEETDHVLTSIKKIKQLMVAGLVDLENKSNLNIMGQKMVPKFAAPLDENRVLKDNDAFLHEDDVQPLNPIENPDDHYTQSTNPRLKSRGSTATATSKLHNNHSELDEQQEHRKRAARLLSDASRVMTEEEGEEIVARIERNLNNEQPLHKRQSGKNSLDILGSDRQQQQQQILRQNSTSPAPHSRDNSSNSRANNQQQMATLSQNNSRIGSSSNITIDRRLATPERGTNSPILIATAPQSQRLPQTQQTLVQYRQIDGNTIQSTVITKTIQPIETTRVLYSVAGGATSTNENADISPPPTVTHIPGQETQLNNGNDKYGSIVERQSRLSQLTPEELTQLEEDILDLKQQTQSIDTVKRSKNIPQQQQHHHLSNDLSVQDQPLPTFSQIQQQEQKNIPVNNQHEQQFQQFQHSRGPSPNEIQRGRTREATVEEDPNNNNNSRGIPQRGNSIEIASLKKQQEEFMRQQLQIQQQQQEYLDKLTKQQAALAQLAEDSRKQHEEDKQRQRIELQLLEDSKSKRIQEEEQKLLELRATQENLRNQILADERRRKLDEETRFQRTESLQKQESAIIERMKDEQAKLLQIQESALQAQKLQQSQRGQNEREVNAQNETLLQLKQEIASIKTMQQQQTISTDEKSRMRWMEAKLIEEQSKFQLLVDQLNREKRFTAEIEERSQQSLQLLSSQYQRESASRTAELAAIQREQERLKAEANSIQFEKERIASERERMQSLRIAEEQNARIEALRKQREIEDALKESQAIIEREREAIEAQRLAVAQEKEQLARESDKIKAEQQRISIVIADAEKKQQQAERAISQAEQQQLSKEQITRQNYSLNNLNNYWQERSPKQSYQQEEHIVRGRQINRNNNNNNSNDSNIASIIPSSHREAAGNLSPERIREIIAETIDKSSTKVRNSTYADLVASVASSSSPSKNSLPQLFANQFESSIRKEDNKLNNNNNNYYEHNSQFSSITPTSLQLQSHNNNNSYLLSPIALAAPTSTTVVAAASSQQQQQLRHNFHFPMQEQQSSSSSSVPQKTGSFEYDQILNELQYKSQPQRFSFTNQSIVHAPSVIAAPPRNSKSAFQLRDGNSEFDRETSSSTGIQHPTKKVTFLSPRLSENDLNQNHTYAFEKDNSKERSLPLALSDLTSTSKYPSTTSTSLPSRPLQAVSGIAEYVPYTATGLSSSNPITVPSQQSTYFTNTKFDILPSTITPIMSARTFESSSNSNKNQSTLNNNYIDQFKTTSANVVVVPPPPSAESRSPSPYSMQIPYYQQSTTAPDSKSQLLPIGDVRTSNVHSRNHSLVHQFPSFSLQAPTASAAAIPTTITERSESTLIDEIIKRSSAATKLSQKIPTTTSAAALASSEFNQSRNINVVNDYETIQTSPSQYENSTSNNNNRCYTDDEMEYRRQPIPVMQSNLHLPREQIDIYDDLSKQSQQQLNENNQPNSMNHNLNNQRNTSRSVPAMHFRSAQSFGNSAAKNELSNHIDGSLQQQEKESNNEKVLRSAAPNTTVNEIKNYMEGVTPYVPITLSAANSTRTSRLGQTERIGSNRAKEFKRQMSESRSGTQLSSTSLNREINLKKNNNTQGEPHLREGSFGRANAAEVVEFRNRINPSTHSAISLNTPANSSWNQLPSAGTVAVAAAAVITGTNGMIPTASAIQSQEQIGFQNEAVASSEQQLESRLRIPSRSVSPNVEGAYSVIKKMNVTVVRSKKPGAVSLVKQIESTLSFGDENPNQSQKKIQNNSRDTSVIIGSNVALNEKLAESRSTLLLQGAITGNSNSALQSRAIVVPGNKFSEVITTTQQPNSYMVTSQPFQQSKRDDRSLSSKKN